MPTTQSTGRVTKLLREKGFGFLREDSGTEYFFHRTAVDQGGFEQLSEGQAVKFTPITAPKGPRAEDVSPVAK
jgi:cold shock protein